LFTSHLAAHQAGWMSLHGLRSQPLVQNQKPGGNKKTQGQHKTVGPLFSFPCFFSSYPVFPFCSFFFFVAGEPDPKVSEKGEQKEKKKRNGKEINDLNLSERKR